MKKVFAFMAVVAAVCAVSCKKGDPTPASEPKDATISAIPVEVEVGKTVKVDCQTNSTATIQFVVDDSGTYTVDASGNVTGVKEGSGNLVLKVDAVEGKFKAAEKTITVTVKNSTPQPPAPIAEIIIDGNFEDWAALPADSYSKTYGDEEATHPALTHCKVYATAEYIYVYFEYDMEFIDPQPGVDHVPFHCYINSDGDATTGGFSDQFSDACTDILLEGFIYGGGEAGGEMGSYDPTAYAWEGEPGGSGWGWGEDILPDGGACVGAGIEGKYEFQIERAVLAGIGFPVADDFSIGFDIQKAWDSVGILPNAAPSEDNPSGVVASLPVKTIK
jgi:hypothetical protein